MRRVASWRARSHARTGRVIHKAIKVLSIKRELRRDIKCGLRRAKQWSNQRHGTINEASKRRQPKELSQKEMQSKPKVISTISAKTCQMGRRAGRQLERAQPAQPACLAADDSQYTWNRQRYLAQNNWQTAGEDMKIWHRNAKSWKQTNSRVCLFAPPSWGGRDCLGLACLFVCLAW